MTKDITSNVTIVNYPEYAKRTLADLGSVKSDLAHMGLGIATEYLELFSAILERDTVNIGEELGDLMWYNANLVNILGLDWDKIIDQPIVFDDDATKTIQDIQFYVDQTKRVFAYNSDIDYDLFATYVNKTLSFVISQCRLYELTFNDVLQKNIGKLYLRFPNKFTGLEALERDTVTERNYLETEEEFDQNCSEFED